MTSRWKLIAVSAGGAVCLGIMFLLFWSGVPREQAETQEPVPWENQLDENEQEKTPGSDSDKETEDPDIEVRVDVKGEVHAPGVYTLQADERVEEAIQKAGGITDRADMLQVNLAERIEDEMVIHIPGEGEEAITGPVEESSGEGALVNVNEAEQVDLETVPGIGPAKATAILSYRKENGSFETIEELSNVSGIGEKTVEQLRDYISL
ncbi:helix-hairpin-helix domain-containing protein [Marinococcus sp. PL1-022]|uniref:helix-hairpin-helix domain-containing protein n=1 Tax=Marinococcus sp. PL1-022 TaxID=3095363 RepID=UPI0029C5E8E2|nr:helix-hairpin-helix domain-containing protein [Marinococcus sp. PL1-022]MDX6153350.1 helix-hairpin-helix domain-containing protein [Marinococcus sp. PL1-022]